MDKVLEAVATSPLPTILGFGGIVFLFLAFGKVGGRVTIDVPPSKRRGFALAGSALLLGAICLYVLPFLLPLPSRLSVATGTPAPTSIPTSTLPHTPTLTLTPLATPTGTPTPMPTSTAAPTHTPTPTSAPTFTPTSTPTLTSTPTPSVVVRGETVNVRTGPETIYDILGHVRRGDELPLVARTTDGYWYQVMYRGRIAWLSASLVQADRETEEIPVATEIPVAAIVDSKVYCTKNGDGDMDTILIGPPRTVARIRIDMAQRATEYGYSLWEVEAYGPKSGDINLAAGGRCDASSAQNSFGCEECFADRTIDGDMNTRWSSDWSDPEWLEITLHGLQVIDRIVLKWENAYATEYCVTLAERVIR